MTRARDAQAAFADLRAPQDSVRDASRPGPAGAWIAAAVGLGLLALLAPAFLVDVPPVMDYPNHFARMWLLAGGADEAPLNTIYAPDWARASTNIATDLAAVTFGRMLGMEVLGPLLLALSVALPPLGAVLLNRAIFRGWSVWQIGFAALGWSFGSVTGFMNFQLGLGVALLAAAAEPGLRARPVWTAAAARFAFGGLLLLFHPLDVLFYGALLGGFVLGARPRLEDRTTWAATVRRVAGVLAPALAPLALMYLLAPAVPGSEPDGLPRLYWQGDRWSALWPAFRTYGASMDAPIALTLAGVIGWAAARRRIAAHGGLVLAAVALAVVALGMPHKIADNFYMDHRLPIMALLTAVAAVRPEPLAGRWAAAVLGAFLLLVGLHRTAAIAAVWVERQADIRSFRRAAAHVPPGAAVLPVVQHLAEAEMHAAPVGRFVDSAAFWHLAALLVPERRAFVPTLFTATGKQPLAVKSPYDQIDSPNSPIVKISVLGRPPAQIPLRVEYLRVWRQRFDYVLVLGADMADEGGPRRVPELELVTDEGFAQLYRIKRAKPQGRLLP